MATLNQPQPEPDSGLIPVNDWSEVPQFVNEEDEARYWDTHCLGEPLLRGFTRRGAARLRRARPAE